MSRTAGLIRWAAATDVGRARQLNEDSWFGGERIYAVADGLGGHRAGEVASRMAVEELARLDRKPPDGDIGAELVEAVRAAGRAVAQRSAGDPETAGMATTVTAIAMDGGAAHLAHVGDSRCYLLRGEQMTLVSTDHTLVARMVDEGAITLEQAETHPQRSVLTRALGTDPEVDVDHQVIPLAPGDRILLCSDGLSSVVPEPEIAGLLASVRDGDDLCRALVDEANRRGGPDNITVLIIDVPADAQLPVYDGTSSMAALPEEPVRRPVAPPPARRTRRVPVRLIVWLSILVLAVAGGLGGLRIWSDRNWFVGFDGDQVAIYRGLPTDFWVSLHRVHEPTALTRDQVEPRYVERLEEGLRASTLEEAREIASRIPRAPTPTPSPTPSPTRSPSVLPSPSPLGSPT
ncbi:MAG TPA: Stp1/IreP family PP2C-type Ser/Thr phosphatase [Actinomycetota bacterium]|nr:Stp1/IreP family PP2C-type Ser/Thr phosphatase [Actinomycetota bacterium]